ncbi:MAG: arginyl-tRNA synthetase [Candidatus Peregrinibacteria bacterium Greene1014_49]|nr:MAG: arginyl-tRNA synthetase [Candidatus Peregrinibacteria bacterium Greene1014_49]
MFESLQAKAIAIIRTTFGIQNVNIAWERPAQADFGDLATPVAMQLAKELKQNPKMIAQTLAEKLAQDSSVEKAEVAGSGYVNVWLKPQALIDELKKTREACTARVTRKEAPVIVEYSQPNVAKPLGIHHILSTVIGQTITNFYRHAGHPVIAWNYMGDWGTQFGKLAVAFERWGKGKKVTSCSIEELLALYVRFHDEAEADPTLEEDARKTFVKLEQGYSEIRAFWSDVVGITKSSLTHLYERLHVHFDCDISESFYEDKMAPILAEGKKKSIFVPGEKGALIVQFSEESKLPPALVQKADEGTLYATRDLANLRYRIDTHQPKEILYVVDVAQMLYFQQLFAIATLLQWELPALEHVVVGRMRFFDKKMSTRKGNILRLEEVLDEAVKRAGDLIKSRGDSIQSDDPEALAEMMGVGSVVYGILSQNRMSELVFDWDRMLSFEGNSAPYLQYTHARARSVLRKADAKGDASLPTNVASLTTSERSLVGGLLRFPGALEEAQKGHLPHVLTHYLYQLCQLFNAFYNNDPILQAPESQKTFRLALTALTATVLKCGAELLTLRVPDRM